MKPTMTLEDIVQDMRSRGMPMGKLKLSKLIKDGTFPFGKVVNVGDTGRVTFLIFRVNYEEWASKYLKIVES